jgi:secreted protein with Ig-like and vWFA domain
MSGQVVLYFEDQADALRFALAAGGVMAGETKASSELVQKTARVSRIRLNATNTGKGKSGAPEQAA